MTIELKFIITAVGTLLTLLIAQAVWGGILQAYLPSVVNHSGEAQFASSARVPLATALTVTRCADKCGIITTSEKSWRKPAKTL